VAENAAASAGANARARMRFENGDIGMAILPSGALFCRKARPTGG
jgi:hypothetical protein